MSFYDSASLAFLPSGGAGKDGKAYSIKPRDGSGDFTFSRGANLSATRIDSNGLIEKGRENLLLQSNSFLTTWTTSNASVTGGQAGYDGSSDAWLLTSLTAADNYINQFVSSSGVQTYSVYAKAGTAAGIWIQLRTGNYPYLKVNLTNGTFIAKHSSVISYEIKDVGNGWYRVSFAANNSNIQARIKVCDASGSALVAGNIYIQDAQLEQGLVATEYIESGATKGLAGLLEDSPRFDYSGGASCPSLLLEPSRTNQCSYSEYIGDSDWVGSGQTRDVTITPTSEINPEGGAICWKMQGTSSDNQLANNSTTTSGTTITNSIYVKRVSGTGDVRLRDVNNGYQDFSLSVADGWKRIDITATATISTARFYLNLVDYTDEILVWGAQQEQGSYPTSYIPNHSGGSVTRNADAAMTIPTAAFEWDGLADGDSATLFIETKVTAVQNNNFNILSQGGSGVWKWNSTTFFARTNNPATAPSFNMGVDINTLEGSTIKIAFVKDDRNLKMFYNGSSMGVVAIGTAELDWCSHISSAYQSTQSLKQCIGFPSALSNTDCEILTGTSYESFAAMATALNYTTYE